jgi:hypothetical protein
MVHDNGVTKGRTTFARATARRTVPRHRQGRVGGADLCRRVSAKTIRHSITGPIATALDLLTRESAA